MWYLNNNLTPGFKYYTIKSFFRTPSYLILDPVQSSPSLNPGQLSLSLSSGRYCLVACSLGFAATWVAPYSSGVPKPNSKDPHTATTANSLGPCCSSCRKLRESHLRIFLAPKVSKLISLLEAIGVGQECFLLFLFLHNWRRQPPAQDFNGFRGWQQADPHKHWNAWLERRPASPQQSAGETGGLSHQEAHRKHQR